MARVSRALKALESARWIIIVILSVDAPKSGPSDALGDRALLHEAVLFVEIPTTIILIMIKSALTTICSPLGIVQSDLYRRTT
jgi:hypothetical protein